MVHNVVTDMAVDNADLVDINFTMDYLKAVSCPNLKRHLDKHKTENFVEMFRGKCREESTIEWIVKYLANTEVANEVAKRYNVPELKDALVRKWTESKHQ